jgi:hypothetical protein
MTSQSRPAAAPAEAPKRDPARGKEPEYTLEATWYCTMKPRRVYPLVVRVPPGKKSVPVESPSGVMATLRPVVPGALVTPAELPLELSRPGAEARFHVTPVARGRLPAAHVRVLCGGREVHTLPVRMAAKTQRLAWLLLLLALAVPALLLHYTHFEPLRGEVADTRQVTEPGGEQPEGKTEQFFRAGSPGEVLGARIRLWLGATLPDFPGGGRAGDVLGRGAGVAYDFLYYSDSTLHAPFWLGALLLILALGSWALHWPTRVRARRRLALAAVLAGGPHASDTTAETLPLTGHSGG